MCSLWNFSLFYLLLQAYKAGVWLAHDLKDYKKVKINNASIYAVVNAETSPAEAESAPGTSRTFLTIS